MLCVTTLTEQIKETFFIDVALDNRNNHPSKICYSILRHIKNRETTTSLPVKHWKPLGDPTCETCVRFPKGGRRPKKPRSGRPKEQVQEVVLSRKLLNAIIEKTPADVIPSDMSLSQFENPHNPHINLCTCHICRNILRRPIMLRSCEHTFCLNCIIPSIEGKTQIQCYECGSEIRYDDLLVSKYVTSILSNLSIECKENCGMYFPINKLDAKREHETICQHQ